MAYQDPRGASQTPAYSSLLVMAWDKWGALKSLVSYKALKAIWRCVTVYMWTPRRPLPSSTFGHLHLIHVRSGEV